MYDLVAGIQCLKSSYVLSKSKALELFPMLKKDKLVGAIVYYDGQSLPTPRTPPQHSRGWSKRRRSCLIGRRWNHLKFMKHLKLDYKQQVHQKVFISLLRF